MKLDVDPNAEYTLEGLSGTQAQVVTNAILAQRQCLDSILDLIEGQFEVISTDKAVPGTKSQPATAVKTVPAS